MKLENIRIVLTRTSHPGNIGATARAMKNMGLQDLALVQPREFPHAEATARASGADDLLAGARVHEALSDAIADCRLVLGASARGRSLAWPHVDARAAAEKALSAVPHGPVAVVFGNEQAGLTNAELDSCHYLLKIPANPDYSSLNLAQAVQVVSYELRMAALAKSGAIKSDGEDVPLARAKNLENLYAHLEQVLSETGFLNPDNPRYLMRRIRRIIVRAGLDDNEVNILRGVLSALQKPKT